MLSLLRSLRPLHWTKNVLLFAPLFLAHRAGDSASVTAAALAFVSFCLTASAMYIVNDLRDLEFDRAHPNKRHRVIASGAVSPTAALLMVLVLLGAGIGIAFSVSLELLAYLAAYGILSLVYSLWFKRRVFLDVLALSALWTIRVLAGGAASARRGLGLDARALRRSLRRPRAAEALRRPRHCSPRVNSSAAPGRGYVTGDRDLLRSASASPAAYMAVLVLRALSHRSPQVTRLYASPRLLWLVCAAAAVLDRAHVVSRASRNAIQDDPIVVAARRSGQLRRRRADRRCDRASRPYDCARSVGALHPVDSRSASSI
jgi:hypothetical protein